jgi:hypothetical protein
MSDHTNIRLETTGGTVVAYLAPNFKIEPVAKNDLFSQARPRGKPSISRDQQVITHQVVAQGVFEHSENLPPAHASDLETLFGHAPVTAREQVNRLFDYMIQEGGPFHLYDVADEYRYSEGSIDYEAGKFPPVNIDEFRPPSEGGFERFNYMIKMIVGVER